MIKKTAKYVFLCIASFLSIFPFLWMIISATNASVDITSGRMMLGNQLFTNIHTLFTTTNIVTGIKNSMIITVAGYEKRCHRYHHGHQKERHDLILDPALINLKSISGHGGYQDR